MKLFKQQPPFLYSDRVHVRLLEPHEAEKMANFRIENRNHLEQWEPRRQPEFFTEGFWQIHLRLNIRDFRDGNSCCFVLMTPDEREVMGVCNYTNIIRGTFQSCQLGYALGRRFEGQGLMYEALSMTNGYMFKELGLNRIMAGYLPQNDRSGSLLERLGFEKEGFARRYLKINGRWEDHVLTSLVNDEH